MRQGLALVALLLVLLASVTPTRVGAQVLMPPTVKAYIDVGEEGSANVTLAFSGEGISKFWITLPKFEKVRVCGLKGSYSLLNESYGAYFYWNTTVTIYPSEDGKYELKLCFNFPYAVLMQSDRAWFMSPLLVAHESIGITVLVRLPSPKKILRESPAISKEIDGYRVYVLSRTSQADMQGRVVVEFEMKSEVPSALVTSADGRITVEYPKPYTALANRTLEIASRAYSLLENITGIAIQRLDFRFYLPERQLGGISALGFVRGEDVNAGGRGPIMLNLALIRFAPGYHETTIIHEMIHVFLGATGVEANSNTRWFHEGLAQYLSLWVAERIGINVTDYGEDLKSGSKAVFTAYNGRLSFVEKWPSGSEEEAAAYLASYYIIANISGRYGSIQYISRLFNALKDRGGARSTREIVLAMSEAASSNLAPVFRNWGFSDVEDWLEKQGDFGAEEYLLLVLLLIGLIAGAIINTLNARIKREADSYSGKF